MMTILKRTTAIAVIAALPIAAGAAGVQEQKAGDQQYQAKDSSQAAQELERTIESQVQLPGAKDGQQATGESTTEDQQAQSGQSATPDQQGEAQSGQSTTPDQQQGEQAQSGQSATSDQQQGQAQSGQSATPDQQQGEAQAGAGDEDATVATVNQKPIKQSEVLGVIAMLPPELQNQPPAVLIPMAIDQLVLRELILQQAEKEGLSEDQNVKDMAQDGSQDAIENAMVQVWLDRNLADAATPQAVEDTYGAIVAQLGDQAPPLDAVRPQIEQELRQQAFSKIADDLQAGADIVLYGPDGKPLPPAE